MAVELKQRNTRLILGAGVVLAVFSFVAVFYLLSHNGNNNPSSGGNAGENVDVVVAKTDLPQATVLTPAQLTLVPYPAANVPPDSYHSPSNLNGRVLSISVSRNTPIGASMLAAAQSAPTSVAGAVPLAGLSISPGNVAFAIPVTGAASGELQSVGYYIQPEDHIDILIDPGSGSVRYGFQDVRVLKVGTASQGTSAAAPAAPTVYIVELPRNQAEQMTLLLGGKTPASIVKYVLRPHSEYGHYEDATGPPVPSTKDDSATAQSLAQLFGH